MNDKEIDDQELAKWDPEFIKQLANVVAPVVSRWFRAEVRGLENVPPVGGALMVSNHSGGVLTPDVPVLGRSDTTAPFTHSPTTASSSPRSANTWAGSA